MAHEGLATRLSRVDLFAGLSDEAREAIVAAGSVFTHQPGRVIVQQGAQDVGMRLIMEGDAVVEVDGVPHGRLGPGDYFGEISLLDGAPRSATITAGESGLKTFAISPLSFDPLLDRHPEMARVLLRALCARLREAETRAHEAPGPA